MKYFKIIALILLGCSSSNETSPIDQFDRQNQIISINTDIEIAAIETAESIISKTECDKKICGFGIVAMYDEPDSNEFSVIGFNRGVLGKTYKSQVIVFDYYKKYNLSIGDAKKFCGCKAAHFTSEGRPMTYIVGSILE